MKKALISLFVIFLLVIVSKAQLPSYLPKTGLVAWYPFNGNANDESGNGNNGIVNGTTLSLDRIGVPNSSYSFDGISNYIDLGINQQINSISGDFSISYWFNTIGKYQTVISSYSNQGGTNWRFISRITWDSAMTDFNVVPNLSWQHSKTRPHAIQYNTWENLIIVRSGPSVFTYLNGILNNKDTVSSKSLNNPTSPFATTRLGYNFASGGGEFFEGNLDDIGIWNRAITIDEITALFNSSNGNVGIGTTDPKRKLHVNDVMRLEPRNAAPDSPCRGDIYYDGILNKLRVYDGTTWQNCW